MIFSKVNLILPHIIACVRTQQTNKPLCSQSSSLFSAIPIPSKRLLLEPATAIKQLNRPPMRFNEMLPCYMVLPG
jgi:hypothetical protein